MFYFSQSVLFESYLKQTCFYKKICRLKLNFFKVESIGLFNLCHKNAPLIPCLWLVRKEIGFWLIYRVVRLRQLILLLENGSFRDGNNVFGRLWDKINVFLEIIVYLIILNGAPYILFHSWIAFGKLWLIYICWYFVWYLIFCSKNFILQMYFWILIFVIL